MRRPASRRRFQKHRSGVRVRSNFEIRCVSSWFSPRPRGRAASKQKTRPSLQGMSTISTAQSPRINGDGVVYAHARSLRPDRQGRAVSGLTARSARPALRTDGPQSLPVTTWFLSPGLWPPIKERLASIDSHVTAAPFQRRASAQRESGSTSSCMLSSAVAVALLRSLVARKLWP
jgi:hypothetical protein